MSEGFEVNWSHNWIHFWKPLLTTDGEWNETKIKAEIHDLAFVAEQICIIYDHLTGGKISSPMTHAVDILACHHDEIEKAYQRGRVDMVEEIKQLLKK